MNKSLGKKVLAVLAAAAVPFTTLLSSAPLTASAADGYIYSDTTQTSLATHKNVKKQATLPDRSIADEDVVGMSDGRSSSTDYIKGRTLDYTYTGNIYTANSSLYDYISDREGNSFSEGYTDPYATLNRAIESTMNYSELYSPSSDNLTIVFEGTESGDKNIKVYLFGDSANNVWDGAAMAKIGDKKYAYTVKYSDLGFAPTGLKITGRNSSSKMWETDSMMINFEKGKSYYCYKGSVSVTGAAENLYKTSIPLYFGCFYREYNGADISYNYGYYDKGDGSLHGTDHNNYYNNFYWQANMSFRRNYDGAVQGLVDNELDDKGNITQNGIKVPYFNSDWAKAHSNLVRYWDNVDFPFYEVSIDADKVHGDAGATGKAIYYQFNSRQDNLYFDQDKGKYKETDTQIRSQGTVIRDDNGNEVANKVRTVSYLPFNDRDSENGINNNLGFGTYFDINFKIRKDGKVDTVDGNGSVNATFEFMGDDDVWVFIDGKLILDLGGDHKDTTGIIDFAEKKAYANDVTKLGYNSNTGVYVSMDNLSKDLTKQLTVDLEDAMAEGTFNSDGTYNQNMTHTLRMFYMERGMFESDLFVRFNFSAIPNDSNLKIKEITRFENINDGLLELTKKAADYDVFDYSISNENTTEKGESGILSPTYNSYQRDNLGQTALLSGQELEYVPVDSDALYLDTSKTLSGGHTWDYKTTLAAWIWKSGNESGSRLYLAQQVDEHLYKFDGFPSDADKVVFLRLNPDHSYTDGSSSWPGDGNVYDKAELSFEKGYIYVVNDWKNNVSKGSKIDKQEVLYETHDFDPANGDNVKNVNYIWTDEFASVISGTDTNGLTGTTDDSGTFRLMYGTDDKESSAEFQKQFTKGSTMTVNQLDSLKTVTRGTTPEDFSTTLSRSSKEYYSTTVTVVDKDNHPIISETASGNSTYLYQNTSFVDANEPVQITETFVNKPNVGAITVTKQLNPDDDVTDTFAFTIRLYDVFGVEGMNVTDYSAIKATVNGSSVTLGADGTFTLKRDETLTIQGVPYGTKYTVTETPAKDYSQQSTTAHSEQKVYTGTFDDTTAEEVQIIPAEANQETVVNTRKTNSLTLSKILEGDYSSTGIDGDTPFDFEVTFTAPEGVDLAKYTFETNPAGIVIANNYKFTVSVSENQPVEISGIPYGTTYTVKETTAVENWSNDGEKNGEIGETASTAAITNSYTPPAPKYGSLKIAKNVQTSTKSDDIPEDMKQQGFKFTITLKNAAGESVSGVFNTQYYLNNIETGSGTVTFNADGEYILTLKDDESIVISNIPVDTVYTVEEAVNAEYEQTFEGAANGTIEENVTAEVNYTNIKKFIPYTLPESGFEDTRMYFVFALSGMMLCGLAYFFVNRKKISN